MIIIGGGKILSIFANIESIAPPMLSIIRMQILFTEVKNVLNLDLKRDLCLNNR